MPSAWLSGWISSRRDDLDVEVGRNAEQVC
jgi:hypothetical protein